MMSMDALLAADPDFKVIHLLRDPRGVVSSRRAMHESSVIGRYSLDGRTESNTVRREAVVYCRTAVRDIRVRQVLEARYPGRILTLKYEDVVVGLRQHADLVYRFLGVGSTPKDTRAWIDQNNAAVAKAANASGVSTKANASTPSYLSPSRKRSRKRSASAEDAASKYSYLSPSEKWRRKRSAPSEDKASKSRYVSPLEKWKKRLSPADIAAIVNSNVCREYFRLSGTNPNSSTPSKVSPRSQGS